MGKSTISTGPFSIANCKRLPEGTNQQPAMDISRKSSGGGGGSPRPSGATPRRLRHHQHGRGALLGLLQHPDAWRHNVQTEVVWTKNRSFFLNIAEIKKVSLVMSSDKYGD